jgi:hypothetical protein
VGLYGRRHCAAVTLTPRPLPLPCRVQMWVGLSWVEVRTALHPVNLVVKAAGSALLTVALLRLNAII